QDEQIVADDADDLVAVDDRGVADAATLEQARAVAHVHAGPHRDDGLRHDLVDVDALGCTVLGDHLLGDIREQHHAVLVALVTFLDDEAGCADAFHDPHRFHHVGAPVDESDVLAHDLSNGYVAHSCFSTTSTSSSAWRMTPTASSTSICTAMPVPG